MAQKGNAHEDYLQEQRYNALDCCATWELFEVLLAQMDKYDQEAYQLGRKLMWIAIEMTQRGLRVDRGRMDRYFADLRVEWDQVGGILKRLAEAGGLPGYNPRSKPQTKKFLHTHLGATPIEQTYKGVKRISVDDEALNKHILRDPLAAPFCQIYLHWVSIDTAIKSWKSGLDDDGRLRSNLRVDGTNTDRWNSKKSMTGHGRNIQNLTEEEKSLIIPDPGYTFLCVDLSQADAWGVGFDMYLHMEDRRYLDMVAGSDLHTTVCRMAWPELPWTGDGKLDRKIADRPYFLDFTYRFLAKKIGHGVPYGETPRTIARQVRIPERVARVCFERYGAAFPYIFEWQAIRRSHLQRDGFIINPLGRRRYFLDRLWDPATHRKAFAFIGQSCTAGITNRILIRLWETQWIQLMIQEHDSILMQIPTDRLAEAYPIVASAFSLPITVRGEQFIIPFEAKQGQNWGAATRVTEDGTVEEWNPSGLRACQLLHHSTSSTPM